MILSKLISTLFITVLYLIITLLSQILVTASGVSASSVVTYPPPSSQPSNVFYLDKNACDQLRISSSGGAPPEEFKIDIALDGKIADTNAPIFLTIENCDFQQVSMSESTATTFIPANSQIIFRNNYIHKHGFIHVVGSIQFEENVLFDISNNYFTMFQTQAVKFIGLDFNNSFHLKMNNNIIHQADYLSTNESAVHSSSGNVDTHVGLHIDDLVINNHHFHFEITGNNCNFTNYARTVEEAFFREDGIKLVRTDPYAFQCIRAAHLSIKAAHTFNITNNKQVTGSGGSRTACVWFAAFNLQNTHQIILDHNFHNVTAWAASQLIGVRLVGALDGGSGRPDSFVRWDNISLISCSHVWLNSHRRSYNSFTCFWSNTDFKKVANDTLLIDPEFHYVRNIEQVRLDHNLLTYPNEPGSLVHAVEVVNNVPMYNITLISLSNNVVRAVGFAVANAVWVSSNVNFFLVHRWEINNNYVEVEMTNTRFTDDAYYMFYERAPYLRARAIFFVFGDGYAAPEDVGYFDAKMTALNIRSSTTQQPLTRINQFITDIHIHNNTCHATAEKVGIISARIWKGIFSARFFVTNNSVGSPDRLSYSSGLAKHLLVPKGNFSLNPATRYADVSHEMTGIFLSVETLYSAVHKILIQNNRAYMGYKFNPLGVPKNQVFVKDFVCLQMVMVRSWNIGDVKVVDNKCALSNGWQANDLLGATSAVSLAFGDGENCTTPPYVLDCHPPQPQNITPSINENKELAARITIARNSFSLSDVERCSPSQCVAMILRNTFAHTRIRSLNISENEFYFKNFQRSLFEGRGQEIGLSPSSDLMDIIFLDLFSFHSGGNKRNLGLTHVEYTSPSKFEFVEGIVVSGNKVVYENCGAKNFYMLSARFGGKIYFSEAPSASSSSSSSFFSGVLFEENNFSITSSSSSSITQNKAHEDFTKEGIWLVTAKKLVVTGMAPELSSLFAVTLSTQSGGSFADETVEKTATITFRNQFMMEDEFAVYSPVLLQDQFVELSGIVFSGGNLRFVENADDEAKFITDRRVGTGDDDVPRWKTSNISFRDGFVLPETSTSAFIDLNSDIASSELETVIIEVSSRAMINLKSSSAALPSLISFSDDAFTNLKHLGININSSTLVLSTKTQSSSSSSAVATAVFNNLPPASESSRVIIGGNSNITMNSNSASSVLSYSSSSSSSSTTTITSATFNVVSLFSNSDEQQSRLLVSILNTESGRRPLRNLAVECVNWNGRPIKKSDSVVGPSRPQFYRYEKCRGLPGFELTDTRSLTRTISVVPVCEKNMQLVVASRDAADVSTVKQYMRRRRMSLTIAIVLERELDTPAPLADKKRTVPKAEYNVVEGQQQSEAFTRFRQHLELAWPDSGKLVLSSSSIQEQEQQQYQSRPLGAPTLSSSSFVYSSTPNAAVVQRAYSVSPTAIRVDLVFPSPAFAEIADPSQPPFPPLETNTDHEIELTVKPEAFACADSSFNDNNDKKVKILLKGRPQIPGLSTAAREAISAGSDVAMVATAMGMSSGPMIAKAKARSVLLQRYSSCEFDPEEPLEFELSPLDLVIGSDVGRYLRGAIIGNGLVFVIFSSLIFALALVWLGYRKYKDRSRKKKMKKNNTEINNNNSNHSNNNNNSNNNNDNTEVKSNKKKKSPFASFCSRFGKTSLAMGLMPVLLNLQTILMQGSVSASVSLYLYGPQDPPGLRAFDRVMAVLCVGASFVFGVWMIYAVFCQLRRYPTIQFVTKEEDAARRLRKYHKAGITNPIMMKDGLGSSDDESPDEDEVIQHILHVPSSECKLCAQSRTRNRVKEVREERRKLRRNRSIILKKRRRSSVAADRLLSASLISNRDVSDIENDEAEETLRELVPKRMSRLARFVRDHMKHSGAWKIVKLPAPPASAALLVVNKEPSSSSTSSLSSHSSELNGKTEYSLRTRTLIQAAKTKKEAKRFFEHFVDLFYDLSGNLPSYFVLEYCLTFIMACIEGYHPDPASEACQSIGTIISILNALPLAVVIAYNPVMRHWSSNWYLLFSSIIITIQSVIVLLGFYNSSFDFFVLELALNLVDVVLELVDMSQLAFDTVTLYLDSPRPVRCFVNRITHTIFHSSKWAYISLLVTSVFRNSKTANKTSDHQEEEDQQELRRHYPRSHTKFSLVLDSSVSSLQQQQQQPHEFGYDDDDDDDDQELLRNITPRRPTYSNRRKRNTVSRCWNDEEVI